MKILITLGFIYMTTSSFAQTNEEVIGFTRIGELSDKQLNSSGARRLLTVNYKTKAKKLAKQDIDNGLIFLLLQGGSAPTIRSTDPEFEKRFDVYFYEFGDSGSDSKILKAYNDVMFKYLTKKYGNEWKKEIRDDVVGFKKNNPTK